jgi:hypothetical protein
VLISCRGKREGNVADRKIRNYQLDCFVLVQTQTDFPSTDQEIYLKSAIVHYDKKFFKIICMPRPPLEIGHLRARTHSTPARTGPALSYTTIRFNV